MKIEEVRAKFPQYSDLSDQQLADALHSKYYADIPKEQFYSQINFKVEVPPAPEEPSYEQKLTGIGTDLLKGAIKGGPLGLAAAGVGAGMKTVNELTEKAAYGAGGKVTDIAAEHGASPETAAALGLGTNVAVQALPMVASAIGTKLGDWAGKAGGRFFMQSAVKPVGKEALVGKGEQAIETMLEKGINVSPRSMQRTIEKVHTLEDSVQSILSKSPETVRKSRIAVDLMDLTKKIKDTNLTPAADLKAVMKIESEMLGNKFIPQNIPVVQANAIKQQIYKDLGAKGYRGELLSAEEDAMKVLARSIKEQVQTKFPEVAKLQKEESDLLNVLAVARARALHEGNKNPGGLAWLVNTPGAALGFFADRSALFKSVLARMLYKGGGMAGAAAGGVAGFGAAEALGEENGR